MKVELEKRFPLPARAEAAWAFLQNVEAVSECMPGAKITERSPRGAYKGNITVRLGPATMSFRGEVEVRDVNAAARSLRLLGKGTDGGSAATMDLAARIEPAAAGASTLVGKSEVSMSGKAASFGARMMTTVADQILKQFGDNFAARVAVLEGERGPPAQEVDAPKPRPQPAVSGRETKGPESRTPSAAPARELNALALAWQALKDWLRGLFSKSAS
jgi:carbon monoxide dehydrogenase subunit G